MKKMGVLVLVGFLLGASATVFAEDKNYRSKYFTDFFFKSQLKSQEPVKAPAAGENAGSDFVVTAIPEYYRANYGNFTTNLDGTTLKAASGHSESASITLLASKSFTETFDLGFLYQFAYTSGSGGRLVPNTSQFGGHQDYDLTANHVAVFTNLNFKEYGRFQLMLGQVFEEYSGTDTFIFNNVAQKRSMDDFKVRITSIMSWYEVDFGLNESWMVTPYVGWRSVYAAVLNQNNFTVASGAPGSKNDSNSWLHLASAGLKLHYQDGPFGATLRGGINYRASSDDVPGVGSRAMAPGVVNYGNMANLDRTMGTYGLGLNYAVNDNLVIAGSYDGAVGSDTDLHSGTLVMVYPF